MKFIALTLLIGLLGLIPAEVQARPYAPDLSETASGESWKVAHAHIEVKQADGRSVAASQMKLFANLASQPSLVGARL